MTIKYFEQIKPAQAINQNGDCVTLDKTGSHVKSSRFLALSVNESATLPSYRFSEHSVYGITQYHFTENELGACFVEHNALNDGDTVEALKETSGFIKIVNGSPLMVPITKGDVLICLDTFSKLFCIEGKPDRKFSINTMLIGDYNATVLDPDEFKKLDR